MTEHSIRHEVADWEMSGRSDGAFFSFEAGFGRWEGGDFASVDFLWALRIRFERGRVNGRPWTASFISRKEKHKLLF
jgi:hypothetical protein